MQRPFDQAADAQTESFRIDARRQTHMAANEERTIRRELISGKLVERRAPIVWPFVHDIQQRTCPGRTSRRDNARGRTSGQKRGTS